MNNNLPYQQDRTSILPSQFLGRRFEMNPCVPPGEIWYLSDRANYRIVNIKIPIGTK